MGRTLSASIRITKMKDQESRQARFPYDRIAFLKSSLYSDTADLGEYKAGKISLDILRIRIAKNNYLDGMYPDGIPEEAMVKFLRGSGWERRA